MAMLSNPFEAPQAATGPPLRVRPTWLTEDVKEYLGIAQADGWGHASCAFLGAGCYFTDMLLVVALFAASTLLLLIYLAKSFPKYLHSPDLADSTKVYGFIGNIIAIVGQIGVMMGKFWYLIHHS